MFDYPVLNRFAIRALKDGASGGLVPADDASVSFYKQGATVKTAVGPFSGSAIVEVYHTGVIAPLDVVQFGADSGTTLRVEQTNFDQEAGQLELTILTSGPVSLDVGDRLVRIENEFGPDPAMIYQNPTGQDVGSPSLGADSEGWVEGYIKDYRFDYIITVGSAAKVFVDDLGSFVFE